jgi:hypothetical protein
MEDYDDLRVKLGRPPTWQEIKKSCRTYYKPKDVLAQQVLACGRYWAGVVGHDGKPSVWTEQAEQVLGRILVEIEHGYYTGKFWLT